jgi:hypothetical protein
MRNRLLTVAPAATAVAALLLGGPASAGSTAASAITSAKLYVSAASQSLGGPGLKIKFTKSQADNDLARLVVYVPTGYTLNTTQAAGTQLGTAAATVSARDLGTVIPVTGTAEVANQPDFAAQATACTGTTSHAQIWVIRLQAAGTTLTYPAFVDVVPTGAPLAEFAAATVAFCPAPSDISTGNPARAPLGASLLTAEFTTSSISSPPSRGEFRWRALVSSYETATGQVDPASTVEIQSLVDLPTTLSLRAKASRSAKRGVENVSYSGSLLSGGKGLGSATVDLYKGAIQTAVKKFKSQTTADDGSYAGSFGVVQAKTATRLFLLAKARTFDQDLGRSACTATFVPPLQTAPVPCTDAAVAAVSVTGSAVKVTIPAGPKPKK